ncbi:MAG: class I SAM-dependent methyltransferase [Chitinophagaceae bacterium]
MKNTITYTNCPVCNSASITHITTVKDYNVSGEEFEIFECKMCTLRFTQGAPAAEAMAPYYKSDDYISHTDSKKGFINRAYHWVRGHTIKSKRKLIEKLTRKSSGTLLDIGAGTGTFVSEMQTAGWQVLGMEPDDTARANALEKYAIILQHPTFLFELENKRFDVITLWHVLEHIHRLQDYIQVFHRTLKDDGYLIIAVPNYTSNDAQHYKEQWAAYDVPRHLYHFSPKSMQKLMYLNGFEVMSVKPMWFDSFYVSLLSEKYERKKDDYFSGFVQGFVSNMQTLKNIQNCSSVIYIIKKRKLS